MYIYGCYMLSCIMLQARKYSEGEGEGNLPWQLHSMSDRLSEGKGGILPSLGAIK